MQGKVGNGVIVAGRVIKDAEVREVGNNGLLKATIAVSTGSKPEDPVVNVVAWRDLAEVAKPIKKGDRVLAVGEIQTREYNGKTYSDLVADWLMTANKAAILPVSVELADDTPLPWE